MKIFFFTLLDCLLHFSGGYNIKTGPGCSIEIMKVDMGGAAAVLGAAKALGQIKPAGVEVDSFLCVQMRLPRLVPECAVLLLSW